MPIPAKEKAAHLVPFSRMSSQQSPLSKPALPLEKQDAQNNSLDIREIQAGFVEEDSAGRVTHTNLTFCKQFGLTEPPGTYAQQYITNVLQQAGTQIDEFGRFRAETLGRTPPQSAPLTTEVASAAQRSYEFTYIPRKRDGIVVGHVWMIRDITDRTEALERLQFQAEVLAQVSDAVVTVGPDMAVRYWNKGAELLTGYGAEEAIGRGPEELLQFRFEKPEDEQAAWGILAEKGTWSGELIISTPHTSGDRHILASGSVLYGPSGEFNGLLAVMRDDTERREMQDRLIHHAYHDTLTGLPNRMMFLRSLDSATASADDGVPDYAVLFLDLDRFKMVNDSLGHHAGDALLKMFAFRLKQCVRDGDVIARLGGDEFAVLLNGVGGDKGAEYVADRILETVKPPFIIEGMEVFSSASVGIVMGDEHYDLAEDLLRDADAAMYQAKRAGRACYAIFDANQQMQASALLQLESDLRRAIERDELRIFYQPIIDLRQGTLYGFEALVRWYHPHRGLITPAQFVGVAEETGLIVDLDRWMLREAADQLAAWDLRFGADLDLSISVNFSNRSFHDPELVDYIASVLDLTGLGSGRLAMEITERVLIEDSEKSAMDLERIKKLGVTISIDDFGTGYASLSVLHALPIDILKIDRSFIKRMDRQDDGVKMVHTVLDLAKSLNMRAVAEGVETQRQLDHLRSMGCTFGQGYLFAKPLDADMTGALVARRAEWLAEIFHRPRMPVRSVA